jgi:hypothetical protein
VVEITKKQDLEKIFQFEFFLMVVEKRRERVCGGSSFIINTVYLLISEVHGPIEVRHAMTLRFSTAWSILDKRTEFRFWMV